MSRPDAPLPAATLTREEIAHIEVGHTTVSPAVRRVLVAGFLAAIALVPGLEFAAGVGAAGTAAGVWLELASVPARAVAHLTGRVEATADARPWRRVVSANRQVLAGLSAFEQGLDDQSVIGRLLRQPAQVVMTGRLGAGNERVYPGRDGWLFYRQDVEYLTGAGFLDATQLRRRAGAADEWTDLPDPDPRPALLRFRDDLAARGISLVLVPVPVKPGVHPDRLARRSPDADHGILQNPSYEMFVEGLRREGVLVFDPSDTLASARRAGPQYLLTDTHWRPEAMELVAERLAQLLTASVPLPDAPNPGYRVERVEVTNVGDTARMLDLPAERALFEPETVWLQRILQPDGSLWRSARDADVLLLGDSFSNIYTLESMGWGTSAGFAEQISRALGRPVDRIVQNDAAAHATRALLHGDAGRLDGKRLVIYQFAVRELAFGDWKVLDLPAVSNSALPDRQQGEAMRRAGRSIDR